MLSHEDEFDELLSSVVESLELFNDAKFANSLLKLFDDKFSVDNVLLFEFSFIQFTFVVKIFDDNEFS